MCQNIYKCLKGFLGLCMIRGWIPPPLRKQCSSYARTIKLHTGVDRSKSYPFVPSLGGHSLTNDVIMVSVRLLNNDIAYFAYVRNCTTLTYLNFCKPMMSSIIFLAVNNHICSKPSNYEAKNYTKSLEKPIFHRNADIRIKFCKH